MAHTKANLKPIKRLHNANFVVLCNEEEVSDEVVVFRLPPSAKTYPSHFFPGKRFNLLESGLIKKPEFNAAAWFHTTTYLVSDLISLHTAFERARLGEDGGFGYIVSGSVAPGLDPKSVPRSKKSASAKRDADGKIIKRGHPIGLVDGLRRWAVLDFDGIPSGGIDPRRDPNAAWARILGYLPPELRFALLSGVWSSSCGILNKDGSPVGSGVPKTIGCHLRFWLDDHINEAQRKDLMSRIRQYVLTRCGEAIVDPATAIFNQAIFCAVSLEGGLEDPFPGDKRSTILDGHPVVCLETLLSELPELAEKTPTLRKTQTPEQKAQSAAERAAARKITAVVRSDRKAHDRLLRAAARLKAKDEAREAKTHRFVRTHDPLVAGGAYGRGKQAAIERNKQIFRERTIGDIRTLVEGRKTDMPGWEHGVPDGMRHPTMKCISALLSFTVPAERLAHEIETLGRELIGGDWMDTKWLKNEKNYAIDAAIKAEEAVKQGKLPELIRLDRYKNAVMSLFQPTEWEMATYHLQALCSEAARGHERRRAAFVPTWEEFSADRLENSTKVSRPWERENISRSAWYARIAADKARAAKSEPAPIETAPETVAEPRVEMVTTSGLDLVIATLSVASLYAPTAEHLAILAAGTGITNTWNSSLGPYDLFQLRANTLSKTGNPKAESAQRLAGGLASLEEAQRIGTHPGDIVSHIVASEFAGIMERVRSMPGKRLVPVSAILEAANGADSVHEAMDALHALRFPSVPLAVAA